MLENTEGLIKKGQSRETDNIKYTKRRTSKQKHNTICVGHHYAQTNTTNYKQLEVKTNQTNTTNVNKTWALLQTTGGKDGPNKHN